MSPWHDDYSAMQNFNFEILFKIHLKLISDWIMYHNNNKYYNIVLYKNNLQEYNNTH